jgi:hypothetical protein
MCLRVGLVMPVKDSGRDLTGMVFGRWSVEARDDTPTSFAKQYQVKWICVCECGRCRSVRAVHLVGGQSRSCGCLARDRLRENSARRKNAAPPNPKKTPERIIWWTMLARCRNPNAANYHLYGGRGIRVCDRWRKSFENFLADMGPRPEGMTLDRIDNEGDYSPENCRWATLIEQANNKRNTPYLEWNGVRKSLKEWSRITGIHPETIRHRLLHGWTDEKALSTPPIEKFRNRSAVRRVTACTESS